MGIDQNAGGEEKRRKQQLNVQIARVARGICNQIAFGRAREEVRPSGCKQVDQNAIKQQVANGYHPPLIGVGGRASCGNGGQQFSSSGQPRRGSRCGLDIREFKWRILILYTTELTSIK